ncbi:MAG: hypothetical protein Q8Q55_01045, partial [Undibacterium sp.]|nr:hypothetical protein [Undibacterium sp.]
HRAKILLRRARRRQIIQHLHQSLCAHRLNLRGINHLHRKPQQRQIIKRASRKNRGSVLVEIILIRLFVQTIDLNDSRRAGETRAAQVMVRLAARVSPALQFF